MRRNARRRASAFLGWILFYSAFLVSSPASTPDIRVVDVKIVAAVEFRISKLWDLEMHKMIRDVSRGFKSRFGIAFKVREVDFWEPEPVPKPLPGHLKDLIEKVPRGKCHLVIGIIPSTISQGPPFGVADYRHAYVLIKDHPSKSGLANVLEHELCHIFGAIDLDESESIMSSNQRGGRYDAFTMRIMTLNRNRSFKEGEFPLTPEVIEDVAAIYRERLDHQEQGRGPLNEEERELQLVLSHIRQEKSMQADLNH
jgi:hypothetical protein